MNAHEILKTIDTSKMEIKFVDFHEMCEKQFEIYEFLTQPDNPRLTYCYYHRWICTDTEVGIRVWYLDDKPVCISFKPYRKYDESFYWIDNNSFEETFRYAISLKQDEKPTYQTIQDMADIADQAVGIEYKQFESFNIKQL
jgi:hypothetical protein